MCRLTRVSPLPFPSMPGVGHYKSWLKRCCVLAAIIGTLLPVGLVAADGGNPCLACDRELRKTMEAIQSWRRMHNGHYPGRLIELKTAGLLPYDGAICPNVLSENLGGNAAHLDVTSRLDKGDPPGTYEYEMSEKVLKSDIESAHLPSKHPNYNRQEFKSVLLLRPFFEQVPILRCSSHRADAPPQSTGMDDVRRNATVAGTVYWSSEYWELLWVDDVPYCAREANVMFGLKGPPFHTDRTPTMAEALDLRKWSCAFGDHPWWWTYPMFEEGPRRQPAAHLQSFFKGNHGRSTRLAGREWWVDGLVQLQGQLIPKGHSWFSGPGMLAFSWKKTGVHVGRAISGAAWLQGTVWPAEAGQTVGWLVWHYADGATERAAIVYGRNTARFWAERKQMEGEKDFVPPVWSHRESTEDIDPVTEERLGRDRWLRVYCQEWANPRPSVVVTSLDFVSNPICPASPFLLAVNVVP
jgi:hypothetical protein